MTPGSAPEPLHRFPVFQTSDPGEFGHAIEAKFGGVKAVVEPCPNFKALGNLVQLQDIMLTHGASSSTVSIDYPETKLFRFTTALTGHGQAIIGGKTTAINERQSSIVSPGREAKVRGEGNHGWLTLRVSASALERRLTSILGYKPRGSLEFETSVDNSRSEVQLLQQLMRFLAQQMDTTVGSLPPLVLGSLEQTIALAFLSTNQHSFSHLLDQSAKDASLPEARVVEEYIEANWSKSIRIEDLVTLTNVSTRSLFRSFRKARGCSPMAFAKMVRLNHAKKMLSSGDFGTSVTGVAFRCGFENAGHFAKHYREAFGELPSATLAQARQLAD